MSDIGINDWPNVVCWDIDNRGCFACQCRDL
jgi:hypothetical protein